MGGTHASYRDVTASAHQPAVPLRLPLSFLLSGAIASVLLGIGAIFVLPLALTDPQAMQVLTLVHTATLGWFTMTIMGAMYQLVPVVLVTRLRAVALAYSQMALYLAGMTLLVSGFWFNALPLLAVGGSLVVAAASVFALILLATILLAPRRPLMAAYLITSLLYLLLVVSLGYDCQGRTLHSLLDASLHRFQGKTAVSLELGA
ncbi:MAG TPA: hypothetical protein VFU69_05410 [Ktedonobacterales bacterium]|nr:hypothetical protein [Ktedonobacterales bacterium]